MKHLSFLMNTWLHPEDQHVGIKYTSQAALQERLLVYRIKLLQEENKAGARKKMINAQRIYNLKLYIRLLSPTSSFRENSVLNIIVYSLGSLLLQLTALPNNKDNNIPLKQFWVSNNSLAQIIPTGRSTDFIQIPTFVFFPPN